jgi:hypothetical protein
LGIKLVGEQTGRPIGTLPHPGIACLPHRLAFPLWDAKRQTFANKIMRTVVVPA